MRGVDQSRLRRSVKSL